MKKDAPIGVFDSGVGGLTVAREIIRQIPNERIVYFGDTARLPYGTKSKDTIIRYARQIVIFLINEGVKAIVVACNTASAYALEEIKDEIEVPIIGVVKPGARTAVSVTKNNRIGVIATEGTINSGLYTKLIHEQNPEIEVIGKACPLLVPLVEEGWLHDDVTDQVLERYLKDLKQADIDTLVLGCTHYPLLRSSVGRIMGDKVNLVNPAYETAIELKRLLAARELANVRDIEEPSVMYRFYVSDAAEKFKNIANMILPFDIKTTKQINIDEY